jgi:hypothetical protein
VPERAPLDVFEAQGLLKQRIVTQIDLADRQVVGGTPPGVATLQFPGAQ